MDYEKAYREALEGAKKLKAGFEGYNANVAIIEKIFPELRESEDERIRKRIRLCLDECVHSAIIRDYERDECLAYLEKQKEQKPLSTEEAELNSIAFLEQMGYTCIPPGKEQKPAEWSEDDDQYLLICENALAKYCRSEHWSYPIVSKWLESHCKVLSQPHWKPSEVQMEALAWYSGNSGVPPTGDKAIKSLYNDLKKLM